MANTYTIANSFQTTDDATLKVAQYVYNGSTWVPMTQPGGGSGSVTSVGITPGTNMTSSGGPITTSGNITVGTVTSPTFTNLTTTGNLFSSVQAAVTAAGNSQGTATALTADIVNVSTTPSGAGVILPTAVAGAVITVTNNGVNTLLVYPGVGAQIDSLSANSSGAIPAGQTVGYVAIDSTHWVSAVNGVQGGSGISVTHQLGGINIIGNTGVLSNVAGTNIAVSGATGNVTISTVTNQSLNSSTATTQTALDSSTKVATTAYVDNYLKPTQVWLKDDFICSQSNTAITAANALQGETNWGVTIVSGGTQTAAVIAGTWTNPGIVQLTTSAVSGQGIALYKGGGANSAGTVGNLAAQGGWELNFVASLVATTLVCIRVGFCAGSQQASDSPTDGIYMEYNTANTGNSDTKFTWVTRAASTSSYSTTGAINADTSYHHFRIWSTVAGTINFSVDGGSTGSLSTNVPTAAMQPFVQVISRTTVLKQANLDFWSYTAANNRT